MHLFDYTIIFAMALILFGPKKLPEMARQVAKLMAEFRRASNEFKSQIDEELRSAEQADRQKQISAAPIAAAPEPRILPPSTGMPVSQDEKTAVMLPLPALTAAAAEAPAAAEPSPSQLDALFRESGPSYGTFHSATPHSGTPQFSDTQLESGADGDLADTANPESTGGGEASLASIEGTAAENAQAAIHNV